jgi:hypothetical protein
MFDERRIEPLGVETPNELQPTIAPASNIPKVAI